MDIVEAIKDKNLLGAYFKDLSSWRNWITFYKVLSGYPRSKFTTKEFELFKQCTGLSELPKEKLREIWLIVGRRGAKSTSGGLLSIWGSLFGGWHQYLSEGETAHVFIVSPNKSQSKIIKNYILAMLRTSPILKKKIKKVLASSIELTNGVKIEIKAASWRTTRGYTSGIILLEECAFYQFSEESQVRDLEIYNSLVPSLTTIKNSLCLGLSTPFAKQGLLWEKHKKHWGKPGSVLIWKAPSWVMNETLTEEGLREQYADTLGAAEFDAEFGANFREDIEGFLPAEIYDKAVVKGRDQVLYKEDVAYRAFADFSEGLRKGADSSTLAISHKANEKIILDYLLEVRAPFDPNDVLKRVVAACESYGIYKIIQDRHSIAWISKDLEKEGIQVEPSGKNKSEIYEIFAVEVNRGNIELLDIPRLRNQTLGLHRFLRSGGAKIDHLPGGHDDTINAVAGACVQFQSQKESGFMFIDSDDDDKDDDIVIKDPIAERLENALKGDFNK